MKVRLRGNDLHILCEGKECPQRWRTLSDLLVALQQTNLDALTNNEQPSIYQVFVYGRKKGDKQPQWCHRVYLNQLDKHLQQVQQALLEVHTQQPAGALIVSNESLARQGNPDAIARYLSETLSNFGVAVQVKVKQHHPKDKSHNENRLWIFCESSYTPDCSLIAEPIAQKLRALKLTGYIDAVIASRVRGEDTHDWLLRIDLTPSEEMLKEWARWGDLQAITRLLTDSLVEKVSVQANLQESTLHIFCRPAFDPLENAEPPNKECVGDIISQLEIIAPQAIIACAIYGQTTTAKQPSWVDWHSLPASLHPALSIPPLELAASGDEPAIIFLLERLLNPNLDYRLNTGGTRVLLLRKGDLLHVMCDAPLCPRRQKVAKQITEFVRQLKIPNVKGVRVYGRRAGNKKPTWNYGTDFEQRERLVPEPTPEFAATSAYVQELFSNECNAEAVIRPDLTSEEVHSFVVGVAEDWVTSVRKFLMGTHLFTESDRSVERNPYTQGRRIAVIWGALGLLITLQTDWILAQIVNRISSPTPIESTSTPPASQDQRTAFVASASKDNDAFNGTNFTTDTKKGTATAILLAARSQIPTFNARQLDEQLALYKQRLAKKGSPPDVLIIGSSRALRGIDPVALSKTLETQGYSNVDVFNFGINGATVQVVDFVVRYVLEPSELPKLILWADGARAFNSGRDDVTFKAIATSAGYKALQNSQRIDTKKVDTTTHSPQESGYDAVNSWLNQTLASFSTTYQKRDQIKMLLNQKLKSLPLMKVYSNTNTLADPNSAEEVLQQTVDFDGFLPLSIRFDPSAYYQKHSKVSGSYDNDYKSFQLAGEQDTALQALLNFTQSKKIHIVFVNMPLTTEYLDPIRTKYEQDFVQYMLRIAERPHFIYRDLSQLLSTENKFFSDPSHLNRYGAYEVSKKLANDPMIPWSKE